MSVVSAAVGKKSSMLHLVMQFGGPGLIALGLLDNSVVPLPGSMDAATILLAAARRDLWWYYAVMATVGGVLGGYLTYRLGVKGGEETLEKKLSKKRAKQARAIFERYGFWSVAVSALCPPPMPIVPILIVAGALKYPWKNFLAALTLGRGVRYTLLAYLGQHYGKHIVRWMAQYYQPLLYTLIGLSVSASLVALYYWWRYKREHPNGKRARPTEKVA